MGVALRRSAVYRLDHGLQRCDALAQTTVIDVTPNGGEGAIWGAGAGLAADSRGYIYFLDANGTFDTTLNAQGFPNQGDYGNAFIKLSAAGGQLTVADYFTMYNTTSESDADEDLGSGGALVLPDMTDAGGQVQPPGNRRGQGQQHLPGKPQ
jgi:hypothetical protein